MKLLKNENIGKTLKKIKDYYLQKRFSQNFSKKFIRNARISYCSNEILFRNS